MENNHQKEKLKKDSLAYVCKYLKGLQAQDSRVQLQISITTICSHIPSLYECMKMMYFICKHEVPFPTAIRSLQIFKLMLGTCQMPCINLIQVYILPYLYIAARHFASSDPNKRYPNPKSAYSRLLHLYETSCFLIVIQWGLIKSKRFYQNQQMQQNSVFFQCMKNLLIIVSKQNGQILQDMLKLDWRKCIRDYCVLGQDKLIKNIQQNRIKFNQNLTKYGNYQKSKTARKYSKFFIALIQEQIRLQFKMQGSKLQQNPPQQIYESIMQSYKSLQFPIRQLPQLNVYLLFQTLDPVLTYPLNQIIFSILQNQQINLHLMKQALRILSKLIRWGDLEAYLNVIYSEQIQQIGKRFLQVRGFDSLKQGQNIFPQISDKSCKLPFYLQYLNFLELFGVCKISQVDSELTSIKLRKLRKQFLNLKFIFPQNLSHPKMRIQFSNNLKINAERNQKLFQQIHKISIKQSMKQITKSFDGPVPNQKYEKNAQLMKSINLVQVLKQQLLDLIKTMQQQYIKLKQSIKNKTSQQKTEQLLKSLKQHMKTLEQQLTANQNQTDPYIHNYLQSTTIKGRQILKALNQFISEKQRNSTLEISKYNISPENWEILENYGSIQKIDYLSDLQLHLETYSKINNHESHVQSNQRQQQINATPAIQKNKQKSKNQTNVNQDRKDMQNFKNIKSQYGLSSNYVTNIYKDQQHLQTKKFSIALSSEVKRKMSIQLNQQQQNKTKEISTPNKSSINKNSEKQQKQQKQQKLAKNIQQMLRNVQITNKKQVQKIQRQSVLRSNDKQMQFTNDKIVKTTKIQRIDRNNQYDVDKKVNSFKECIKNLQMDKKNAELASDYITSRSRTKSKSKLQVFSKQSTLKHIKSQHFLSGYQKSVNSQPHKIINNTQKFIQAYKQNKNNLNSHIKQFSQYYSTIPINSKSPQIMKQNNSNQIKMNNINNQMTNKIIANHNKRKGIQLVQMR